ncbi:MAG: restriction endonuclease subunit S, partial [Selenomonadaceae bacterium]|nr:restriction endonuclease subunit S [Selenomonadaceae bacterium]
NSQVIAKYVCYFMQSKFYYNQLKKYTLGTTRKRISRKNLGIININVPNLSQQQKIVDVLDKVENLIDNRQQQLNLLDELIESRFIEMFGDPVTNPMNWDKFKLLDKCDIVTGNTPSRNIPEYYGNTIGLNWIILLMK